MIATGTSLINSKMRKKVLCTLFKFDPFKILIFTYLAREILHTVNPDHRVIRRIVRHAGVDIYLKRVSFTNSYFR